MDPAKDAVGTAARLRLRAPAEHGAALVHPTGRSVGGLVAANRDLAAAWKIDLFGRPLSELRGLARGEMLRDASRPQGVAGATAADAPILLTGHQPGPWHSGVWFKNLALNRLCGNLGCHGVFFSVDSDLCTSVSATLPTGTPERPQWTSVAYDVPCEPLPFEERGIGDPAVWASFGARAAQTIAAIEPAPLIGTLWNESTETALATGNLGEAWSVVRRGLEDRWGVPVRETALGRLCTGVGFAAYACQLIDDLPRFQTHYNAALAEYRRRNKLRSAAHPAPDLHAEDGWLEAPFWVWRREDPRRRPLFTKLHPGSVTLADRAGWRLYVPRDRLLEAVLELEGSGVKLRTRALTTTLYARMVLCDLFLHGIGGAKYDEVTDALMRSYFDIQPPGMLTLTATLHLPIAASVPAEPPRSSSRGVEELRALRFHPERFLSERDRSIDAVEAATQQKTKWINQPKTPENAADRHRGIVSANSSMLAVLEAERTAIELRTLAAQESEARGRILRSRELPLLCFPETPTRATLLRLTETIPV